MQDMSVIKTIIFLEVNMKKAILAFLIFIGTISCAGAYTDHNEYAWASAIINKWSSRGIISGYGDGTFRGNNYLTRAELITILNKINNSGEIINKRPSKDISEGDWYYKPMALALNSGLIELDSSGNLRPNDKATREEAFVMIAKIFKFDLANNSHKFLESFKDYTNIEYKNIPYIGVMVKEKYINGYGDSTIRAKGYITRAELTCLLDNMVGDIYSSGKFSNKTINGNLVINGENVELTNIEVRGSIFILEGAKDNIPILKDVEASKGIVSRVGTVRNDITVTRTETIAETESRKEEDAEPIFARITYSETDWTNQDVTATIRFDNSKVKVTNNSGKKTYRFTKNGEFTFECEDEYGNEFKFKAKVDNIVTKNPQINVQVDGRPDSATVTVVATNGEVPIDSLYYIKGNYTAPYTVRYGNRFNDTFEIYESGVYTVAAEDEAGNVIKESFTWNATAEYTIEVTQSTGGVINSGTSTVAHSTNKTFTIIPDSGYSIEYLIIDGEEINGATSYTFSNVKSNHTISAEYTSITYSITYDLDDGTATNPTEYTVESGNIALDNPVKAGYVFVGWTGSNGNIPETDLIISAGTTGDKNYIANWASGYMIIVIPRINGTINPGTKSGSFGDEVTFTIIPDTGYHIKDVIIDEVGQGAIGSYTFTNITQISHTLTALFEPHSGGTATCVDLAECAICGEEYGNFGTHIADINWTTDGNDHWKLCTVCEGIAVSKENHNFPTTLGLVSCIVCGRTRINE